MTDRHLDFTNWAQEQGVEINGITAAQMAGRGVGIIATRHLKAGETIYRAPAKALITMNSGFVKALRLPAGTTVHCWLTLALMLNPAAQKAWRDTWPSATDFNVSMPICWPEALQAHLPEAARNLLTEQQLKLTTDWAVAHPRAVGATFEDFRYYWLLVNTRCFYWEHSKGRSSSGRKSAKRSRRDPDDCMALAPFADFLNHSDKGCAFDSNPKECYITCDRDYAAGEEVVVCYGAHSNDFLLVEYGFIMEENKHDTVPLDSAIMSQLDARQREALEAHRYLGHYTLSGSGICFRTQCALRALVLPKERLERFLGGGDEDEVDWRRARSRWHVIFQSEIAAIAQRISALEAPRKEADGDLYVQIDLILRRLRQIRRLWDSTATGSDQPC